MERPEAGQGSSLAPCAGHRTVVAVTVDPTLGLDVGTTATKAVLLNPDGTTEFGAWPSSADPDLSCLIRLGTAHSASAASCMVFMHGLCSLSLSCSEFLSH